MIKAYKYRLYPTKQQIEKLQWTLDRCRVPYNDPVSAVASQSASW